MGERLGRLPRGATGQWRLSVHRYCRLTVTVVINDNSPPSGPSSRSNIYSPGLELFFAILELAILAMLNFVGIVLSVAGGRVGGTLAILLAKRLQQTQVGDV